MTHEILISSTEIKQRIREIADEINRDYAGKELLAVCILKGAVIFASDLIRLLTVPVSLDFMVLSSYNKQTSTGIVTVKKDMDIDPQERHILIIEDIIDTGHTVSHLMSLLKLRNPASIKLCSLISKPSRREVEVDIDYLCFNVPDEFIVGYGLDYEQHFRNLPNIEILKL